MTTAQSLQRVSFLTDELLGALFEAHDAADSFGAAMFLEQAMRFAQAVVEISTRTVRLAENWPHDTDPFAAVNHQSIIVGENHFASAHEAILQQGAAACDAGFNLAEVVEYGEADVIQAAAFATRQFRQRVASGTILDRLAAQRRQELPRAIEKAAPPPTPTDERNHFCWESWQAGGTLKEIWAEVNRHPDWEPLEHPASIRGAIKSWAMPRGLPIRRGQQGKRPAK